MSIAWFGRLSRALAYPDSPACHVVLAGLDAPATIDVIFTVYDVIGIRPNNIGTMGAQCFHVVGATGGFSLEHTL